jgi:cobalt/nickel transport system permease protein
MHLHGPHPEPVSPAEYPGVLGRLDARAKIVALVGFVVVVVTTPADAFAAFALYGLVLSFLVGLAHMPLRLLGRRLLLIMPFVVVVAVFLPFFHRHGAGSLSVGPVTMDVGGLLILFNVTVKALLAVTATSVLLHTTGISSLLAGLERLRVPRVFVLMVSFLHRYSFVVGEEFRRMRTAMDSRNYRARWLWQGGVLGRMVGALFVRSYERAERVHLAMVSRGYCGAAPPTAGLPLSLWDGAFMAAVLLLAVSIRVAGPYVGA